MLAQLLDALLECELADPAAINKARKHLQAYLVLPKAQRLRWTIPQDDQQIGYIKAQEFDYLPDPNPANLPRKTLTLELRSLHQ